MTTVNQRPATRRWRDFCMMMAVAILGAGAMPSAQAADTAGYPNRPIRVIAPSAAGSQLDTTARTIAAKLADALGQPVVIENHTGGSYNIASELVAKAPADGYTLLYTGSSITLLPSTLGKVAVDPVKAFAPVTKLVIVPMVIVVNASLGVRTLDELMAMARQRPGRVAYSTFGVGTIQHLAATLVARHADVELLHVPYVNGGQALKDLLTGEVPVGFAYMGPIDVYLRSGELRALAVLSTHRMRAWPDIPSVAELGFKDAAVEPWNGFLAPAGTPPEIIDRLYREIANILQQPEVVERFGQMGLESVGSTPERFAADIREAVARWPAIVRSLGIHPD